MEFEVVLVLLAVPAAALAQRDLFFAALAEFHKSSAGLYGDEGPLLTARLDAMSKALDAWDRDIRDAETELRVHLAAGPVETQLQVHTLLAARYLERGRFADAVREFDEDIRIDPRRASFHRLRALALLAMSRRDEAADVRGRLLLVVVEVGDDRWDALGLGVDQRRVLLGCHRLGRVLRGRVQHNQPRPARRRLGGKRLTPAASRFFASMRNHQR